MSAAHRYMFLFLCVSLLPLWLFLSYNGTKGHKVCGLAALPAETQSQTADVGDVPLVE